MRRYNAISFSALLIAVSVFGAIAFAFGVVLGFFVFTKGL